MTRAKTLKHVIRNRAAKTGERYTTARRQILKDFETSKAATVLVAKPAPQPPALATKGSLSDAKVIEKTGHDLAHWFALLDALRWRARSVGVEGHRRQHAGAGG